MEIFITNCSGATVSPPYERLFLGGPILPHPSRHFVTAPKVEFKPIPNNCDIDINGVFYGNSPLVAELPAGVTVNVKISKPGYVSWEKAIIPREGMKISPELIKEK